MSGIAGIVRLEGRPVRPQELSAMTEVMAHRGPDGSGQWVGEVVGLGHCMFKTTAQSLGESQPTRNEHADICITLDGRIDNRPELASALGRSGGGTQDLSDSELVLRCYERWDTACVPRLRGDFALGIWDGRRRRLLGARDFLGKRPFFYWHADRELRFASEPQAVLLEPRVSTEPDAGFIAELLSAQLTSTSDTVHAGVKRLPPAHVLLMDEHGLRVQPYWSWNEAEIRYADDRDYAAHLLDLFQDAVQIRLSSPWPVAASLSGGVDSSSVLGVAHALDSSGRATSPHPVYGMVYPGLPCDERPFIRDVARHLGIDVAESRPEALGAGPYEEQIQRYRDLPDYPMTMAHRQSWAHATGLGCRSILTGKGPDEWLAGSHYSLADHLKRRQPGAALRELRSDAPAPGFAPMARHFWAYGLRPFVPGGALQGLRSAFGRRDCPQFLTARFCEEAELGARVRSTPARGRSLAATDLAGSLDGGWQAHANEMDERAMSAAGLEGRDPLDDRRIVEFALALPEEQRRRGELNKYVLRQAVRGLIPESVRTRADKADYSHLIADELRAQGGRSLFQGLRLVDIGWVDGPETLALYDRFEHRYAEGESGYRHHLWSLWLIAAVDRWIRV